MVEMNRVPKVIPPRSRVRLVRADKQTPHWNKQLGRQFRVGYYSRKDGLECIWLVDENGKYEQTTDRNFISKYFQIERVSQEKNFYGVGKRCLSRIRLQTPIERLNGRSSVDVFEAAKELWEKDDPDSLRSIISTLRRGKRVVNRTAAAYALNLMHAKPTILALEKSLGNRQEHPRVRGQSAESLAHNHRENSHRVVLKNLMDPSKEVRFWCAFALAQMGDGDALLNLRKLAKQDRRIVRGFWSVIREAKAAIRRIQDEIRRRGRHHSKRCLYCPSRGVKCQKCERPGNPGAVKFRRRPRQHGVPRWSCG